MAYEKWTCPYCLSPRSLMVRADRRGRPYTHCATCWTRSFVREVAALRGVRFATDMVAGLEAEGKLGAVLAECEKDPVLVRIVQPAPAPAPEATATTPVARSA